jgi:hypothetical protein
MFTLYRIENDRRTIGFTRNSCPKKKAKRISEASRSCGKEAKKNMCDKKASLFSPLTIVIMAHGWKS